MNAIVTQPSIKYLAKNINSSEIYNIDNPLDIKRPELIKTWYEPICTATIMTPLEFHKGIKTLCLDRRGVMESETFLGNDVVNMVWYIPLSELVIDFFDILKSMSKGYASLDYEHKDY
jgi:GTP-binding protein LepA